LTPCKVNGADTCGGKSSVPRTVPPVMETGLPASSLRRMKVALMERRGEAFAALADATLNSPVAPTVAAMDRATAMRAGMRTH